MITPTRRFMITRFSIFGLLFGGFQSTFAAIALPLWVGDPQTTSCGYLFETNDDTPSPDSEANPYGASQGFVSVASDGTGTGWQDPVEAFNITMTPDSGAWDLGISGTVEIDLKVGPDLTAGQSYEVEFQVRSISYILPGLIPLPSLSADGLTPDSETSMTELFLVDPVFSSASWQEEVWEGVFKGVTDENLTFVISAPNDGTSVVESVEIFTRYTLIETPPSLSNSQILPDGSYQLTLTGVPGVTYTVQQSEDLITWSFKEDVTLVSTTALITDSSAQSSQSRFFRAAKKTP